MPSRCTSASRHILDIFINIKADQPCNQLVSAATSRITVISLRVHDEPRFTETRLEGTDEAQILRQFWLFIATGDLFIDPKVHYEIEFIRQRTAALGLFPAFTADLDSTPSRPSRA
jgi:hypothetical protein